jgi:hypothetical protein
VGSALRSLMPRSNMNKLCVMIFMDLEIRLMNRWRYPSTRLSDAFNHHQSDPQTSNESNEAGFLNDIQHRQMER